MDDTTGNACPTVVSSPGTGALRHGLAVVESDQGLLDIALPFVREGIARGDLTVLTCPPDTTRLVQEALGVEAVQADPRLSLLGARPPDAFQTCREYAQRAARSRSGRLRVFAETVVPPQPRHWREELRVEAVLNRALAELPMTALCLYDRRRVPADVVESVRRSHPEVVTASSSWAGNAAFEPPAAYVRGLPVPRESVENLRPVFVVDDASTLPDLRHALGAVLDRYVPDPELREDLHLALSEVAANAFRHGRRPVSARLWVGGDRIVCRITDGGRSFDDPLAGFVPAHGYDLARGGMGLWLARKLWDHVDLLPGPDGFTVRLSTALH